MASKRVLRVLALALVVMLVFTLPLAGCSPKPPPASGTPGGSTAGGGTTPGGTTPGGSTGDTAGGTPDTGDTTPGGSTGDTAGGTPDTGDATPGRSLGDWSGEWAVGGFRAGQRYKYEIRTNTDGAISIGWSSLDFSAAGADQLRVEYAGNVGLPFSGSFTTSAGNVDLNGGISDSVASVLLMPLLLNPFVFFFTLNEWNVGRVWTLGEGDDVISFEFTGKRSYAGVEGMVGEFTMGGATSVYVINPYVPLVLYCKMVTDDRNWMEYKLVELSGF